MEKMSFEHTNILHKKSAEQAKKRAAVAAHNAKIEADGYESVKPAGVLVPALPSQRSTLAIAADRTSSTPRRKGKGYRMRNRAGGRIEKIMNGRTKINRLFVRAGIYLSL